MLSLLGTRHYSSWNGDRASLASNFVDHLIQVVLGDVKFANTQLTCWLLTNLGCHTLTLKSHWLNIKFKPLTFTKMYFIVTTTFFASLFYCSLHHRVVIRLVFSFLYLIHLVVLFLLLLKLFLVSCVFLFDEEFFQNVEYERQNC